MRKTPKPDPRISAKDVAMCKMWGRHLFRGTGPFRADYVSHLIVEYVRVEG